MRMLLISAFAVRLMLFFCYCYCFLYVYCYVATKGRTRRGQDGRIYIWDSYSSTVHYEISPWWKGNGMADVDWVA